MKYNFYDDYSEGVHPEILKYISEHNLDQQLTYGRDEYCTLASERIKKAFGIPNANIHFLPTGTVCNVIGLKAMLKPFEGVIAPVSGHINTHETGALEAAGNKIVWVDSPDGKLTTSLIDLALSHYENEHTVFPRVVYLTQVTELGTVYTKNELANIVKHAKSKGLYTYLDGARLAMAIMSNVASITTEDVGNIGLDMFYLGGTKNGGMYGEALVIQNDRFKPDFRSYMKQRGGMMSKGRFMGQQFARFFDKDQLWLSLADHANNMAHLLYEGLRKLDISFEQSADANLVFPIFDKALIEKISTDYGFSRWNKIDQNRITARLVCSWATPVKKVTSFISDVSKAITTG